MAGGIFRITTIEEAEELRRQQLAKCGVKYLTPRILAKEESDDCPENDLQGKCEKWLRARGYPFIHDRSRRINAPGSILDLHIYLPKGRHVVIELKAKGGKMSDEQKETYQKILFLGHEIHEVRSYKRFLEIMEAN